MMILVIGPPDSGKSLLAEELTLRTACPVKYYLATMKVMDPDGKARVEKHRRQRAGKGFVTIERESGLSAVAGELRDPENSAVLLECVSNLVGNEMHDTPVWKESDFSDPKTRVRFARELVGDLRALAGRVQELVIVTAEYEKENSGYDEDTRNYIILLDQVNAMLMAEADEIHDLRKPQRR